MIAYDYDTVTKTSSILIVGYVRQETGKAILFQSASMAPDIWLPKSQMKYEGDSGCIAGIQKVFRIPAWLYKKNEEILVKSVYMED